MTKKLSRAIYYTRKANHEKTVKHAQLASMSAAKINYSVTRLTSLQYESMAYMRQRDYHNAYRTERKKSNLQTKVYDIAAANLVADAAAKYDLKRQQKGQGSLS